MSKWESANGEGGGLVQRVMEQNGFGADLSRHRIGKRDGCKVQVVRVVYLARESWYRLASERTWDGGKVQVVRVVVNLPRGSWYRVALTQMCALQLQLQQLPATCRLQGLPCVAWAVRP